VGKSQYDILADVLSRLNKSGVLEKVVLIGSWCLPLYRDNYFKGKTVSTLRTRDVDFLVGRNVKFRKKTDIPKLLEDMGFIPEHSYPDGHMRLTHPELIIEFLVPEAGRGSSKPYPLPELSMNAQRLRFLDILYKDAITVDGFGLKINIPHPINFGLHKLLVLSRRGDTSKAAKDLEAGISILRLLVENGEGTKAKKTFDSLSKNQRKTISQVFADHKINDLLELFHS